MYAGSRALHRNEDLKRLQAKLSELAQEGAKLGGFPLFVNVGEGTGMLVQFAQPPLLDMFGPHDCGVALYTEQATCEFGWGRLDGQQEPELRREADRLAQAAARRGEAQTIHRGTVLHAVRRAHQVWVLALHSRVQAETESRLAISERQTTALRRLGKALSLNQTLQPLGMMAAHAIQGSLDLSAVLIWVERSEGEPPELLASVGVDRSALGALQRLEDGMSDLLAEQVWRTGQGVTVESVSADPRTVTREALFCMSEAGPVCVYPLKLGVRTIGVLELVARRDDPYFTAHQDFNSTLAEHLSLAVHSALMFEQVERLATTDPLTGIANHRTLQEFLHRQTEYAGHSGEPLSVIMVDVDHFRQFNEEEGHDGGDTVLRLVADVLRRNVRDRDLAARYGGEEFTLVLPGCDETAAFRVAERVRRDINHIAFRGRGGMARPITASFGVAASPTHGHAPEGLLQAADTALYRAKRSGRNRTVVYARGLAPASDSRPVGWDELRQVAGSEGRLRGEMVVSHMEPLVMDALNRLNMAPDLAQTLLAALFIEASGIDLRDFALKLGEVPEGAADALTCLRQSEVRYDDVASGGANAPLLARLLAVFRALVQNQTLNEDAGRFDPVVVETVLKSAQAA